MAKQSPTHTAYHVRKYKAGGDEKSFWTKIGSAWPHGDGEGFNLKLNGLLPMDGQIVVRPVKESKDTEQQGDESAFVDADGVVS